MPVLHPGSRLVFLIVMFCGSISTGYAQGRPAAAASPSPTPVAVVTDNKTILGNGTSSSPLHVAVPLTVPLTLSSEGSSSSDHEISASNFTGTGLFGTGPHAGVEGQDCYAPDCLKDPNATHFGVHGLSKDHYGVAGEASGNGTGVFGAAGGGGAGVEGDNFFGTGVFGQGLDGVVGFSFGGTGVTGDGDTGVAGMGNSVGVFGEAETEGVQNGQIIYGVWGKSSAGQAGHFDGNVVITGNLSVEGTVSKSGSSFKIDHPLDPANKYLSHSVVESPDMMNIYNGNITTDGNGLAKVSLPAYFEKLNGDFRYQLTVIGQFAQAIVETEIKDNSFSIRTDRPCVKVSWQVTGVRRDAWANAHRIVVEEEKTSAGRGAQVKGEDK